MAHVLRERIVCYDKDAASVTVMPSITNVDDVKAVWTKAQKKSEESDEIVYYLKADTNPNFKWAVYLVLLGCVANLPLCVMLDGVDMGVPPFTLRAMMRTLCVGCSKLTTSQFVSILERLAHEIDRS